MGLRNGCEVPWMLHCNVLHTSSCQMQRLVSLSLVSSVLSPRLPFHFLLSDAVRMMRQRLCS